MLLYHYCSLETFVSIIKSKMLWMSSLNHMNDPMEIQVGIQFVSKAFKEVFPEISEDINWNEYEKNYYLCCSFSLAGDVLSQWRAYSQNGTGVALGLDSTLLAKNNSEDDFEGMKVPSRHSIERIHYNKNNYFSFIKEFLTKWREQNGIPSNEREMPCFYLSKMVHTLFRHACLYKDAFYKEEKEVRYILPTSKLLIEYPIFKEEKRFGFRVSDFGLTPYSKLNLMKNNTHSIRKVILGPKNPSRAYDIELFLKTNGFDKVKIYSSKGSYR